MYRSLEDERCCDDHDEIVLFERLIFLLFLDAVLPVGLAFESNEVVHTFVVRKA